MYGELVDRFGVGNLVLRLVVLEGVGLFEGAIVGLEKAFATEMVHIDYSDETSYKESDGGNGESEVGTCELNTFLERPSLIDLTEIEGLSGTLSIAHGEEESAGIEEVFAVPPKKEGYGDEEAYDALDDIGGSGYGTCFGYFHRGASALDLVILKCERNEADTEGVVGDNLHCRLVDEAVEPRNEFEQQDDDTGDEGGGDEAATHELDFNTNDVGNEECRCYHEKLDEPSPGLGVGKCGYLLGGI